MKVVIVAKTRMGSGACIGGITFNGRSVRLIAPDQEWNDQFNMGYNVGEVWDVDYKEDNGIIPPHVENIIIHNKRKFPPIDDPVSFIKQHMPPRAGGIDMLYEGLTQATKAGALYITERTGIPPFSTMFWQPDKPLVRDDDGKRIRYRYPTEDGGRTLTFTGFQEPIPKIPAEATVRVSLAHWWRPDEMNDGEYRCYVQLSGWFLSPVQVLEVRHSRIKPIPSPIENIHASDSRSVLKNVFGYEVFRPLQEEIIDNILNYQDTLAVMPTGSGKSLCYQIPALLFPGVTVVISPLISLMEDQVMQLREVGIPAVFLNSTLSYQEYQTVTRQIINGQVKLLYTSPETLLRPETMVLLEKVEVNCLTIDEAHCISEWGHDFRPEYRQLVDVRRRLTAAVCLAVTATATERVQDDIALSLQMPDSARFIASFNRENLFLAVEPKTNLLDQTLHFLEGHREESGIIYCATRDQVDTLTAQLQSHGWSALPYHAGLEDETRRLNQGRFIRDEVPIMVATIAFGMGINKSNVRFILHVDLPKNLESYYQQIGRAGRDGLQADCLLLYSYGDVSTINYFISQQADSQQIGAKLRLEAMLGFVETNLCRRRPLLTYFGESYEVDNCDCCDNCIAQKSDLSDLTIPAQKFLSCVKRTGEWFGVNHIIKVLRGSREKLVSSRGHDKLSTYSIGKEFSKKEWQYLARQFIQHGLVTQDKEHGSLKLTADGYQVLRGERFLGMLPAEVRPFAVSRSSRDEPLFALLRAKRKELSEQDGVPPYIIFSDRSLEEMATFFPQSRDTFSQIIGVGHVKLEKYGEIFIPLIQAYCREQGIREVKRPATVSISSSSSGLKNRTQQVLGLYNTGSTIHEIAQTFNVKQKTVINHLWKAVQSGESISYDGLLSASNLSDEEQQKALAVFAELGVDLLQPVYMALDHAIEYDELHLLRLYCAARDNP